jgi:beta-lactamase regulating signal transducer with metallopeptidase domain
VLFCFLLLLWLLGFLIGLLFVLLLLGVGLRSFALVVFEVNEARKLDGEKKRIVKATADALTTAKQQQQETEKTTETASKTQTLADQSIQRQTTDREQLVLRFLLLVFLVRLLGCLLVFFSLMLRRFVVLVLSYLNGKVIMVANGKPGMAPSDIDSLKQKADELDQQLEKLTAGFCLFLLFFLDGLFCGFFCLCFLFDCLVVCLYFFF